MGKGTGEVTEYSSMCQSVMSDDRENTFFVAVLRVCSCFTKFERLDIFRTVLLRTLFFCDTTLCH